MLVDVMSLDERHDEILDRRLHRPYDAVIGKQLSLNGSGDGALARGPSYLSRMLDVLERALATESGPLSLSELSRVAGVPVSTVSRLTSLLVERGLLRNLPGGGLVAGPQFLRLAVKALGEVQTDARIASCVRSLALTTGESVSAGMLIGDSLVLIAREEPVQSLRAVARVGESVAPHTSAMGKAVLARLDTERRLAVLRRAVGDGAEQVDESLREELDLIREHGFALDEETFAVGLRCRGAAFVDHEGIAVGGLSIAGPAARFTYELATGVVPALLSAVQALSAPFAGRADEGLEAGVTKGARS